MGLQSLLGTRSQEQNGVVTIALSGDLDLATAPIRNRAMSNGQRLIVRGASPTAQRHIEIVGLQFLLDDPEHDLESQPG
jgi:anti-anti-sigma regulatory factor